MMLVIAKINFGLHFTKNMIRFYKNIGSMRYDSIQEHCSGHNLDGSEQILNLSIS